MSHSQEASLPPLYSHWMAELLDGPIPVESEATCEDCVMCADSNEATSAAGNTFDPTIKCCTYMPELPNFLVGRILADERNESAPGRKSVRGRIAEGTSVTPLGVGRSVATEILYDHISKLGGFGRSSAVRCPHYLADRDGQCGIWENRNGVCCTWFCKHVRGSVAGSFWSALQRLFECVEADLARWCVLEMDIGGSSLQGLFHRAPPADGDSSAEATAEVEIWGKWIDRKEEFYRECGGLVGTLDWAAVSGICGAEVRVLARLVRDGHRQLLNVVVPELLRAGSFKIIRLGDQQVRVGSYSLLDPLDIPRQLFDVLHYFDGETSTSEVLAEIALDENIPLDASLIRTLVDFQILVPQRNG